MTSAISVGVLWICPMGAASFRGRLRFIPIPSRLLWGFRWMPRILLLLPSGVRSLSCFRSVIGGDGVLGVWH